MLIPFSASARTAILIGSENFSNPDGAVIELIKNAYDADSHSAYLFFKQGESGKEIYLLDYGCGMSLDTLRKCWMRIGTDDKLVNATTSTGRVKSGAKGIGRFALNRLGHLSSLVTITKEGKGLFWNVDWDEFSDNKKNISDINANVDEISIDEIKRIIIDLANDFNLNLPSFTHGTMIKISGLKDNWDSDQLQHLFISLGYLIPAFNAPSFNIFLYSDDELDKFGQVEKHQYDDFDYRLLAKYEKSTGYVDIRIWRNELDLQKLETSYHDLFDLEGMKNVPLTLNDFKRGYFDKQIKLSDLNIKEKSLLEHDGEKIGSFTFEFYFLKTSKSDVRDESNTEKYPYRLFSPKERRDWLKDNQGIKLYRDKFRVRPYGENGDDWLHLSERYASSPGGAGQRLGGYHVRQTQIAGAVEISRLDNPYLEDKSGREGIQENSTFELFKKILISIISIMEHDRNVVMYNLSQLYDIRNPKEKAKNEANNAQREFTRDNYNALVAGYRVLEEEIASKEDEMRLLRNLASTGLLVTSFAHELKNIAIQSDARATNLKEALDSVTSEEKVAKLGIEKYGDPYYLVSILKEQDSQVRQWVEFAINSVNKDKRERVSIDLCSYFDRFQATWNEVLNELNIDLEIVGFTDKMVVKAFSIDLDTIFNNLISNSIYSIKSSRKTEDRKVIIEGNISDDLIIINFIDHGKGLDPKYKDDPGMIFNAFESTRTDKNGNIIGTGLGLYIVKTTLSEYKDSSISYDRDISNGFGMRIALKNEH